jgi:hypothetical protein
MEVVHGTILPMPQEGVDMSKDGTSLSPRIETINSLERKHGCTSEAPVKENQNNTNKKKHRLPLSLLLVKGLKRKWATMLHLATINHHTRTYQ